MCRSTENGWIKSADNSNIMYMTAELKQEIINASELVMQCGWEQIPLAVEQHSFALDVGTSILYASSMNNN